MKTDTKLINELKAKTDNELQSLYGISVKVLHQYQRAEIREIYIQQEIKKELSRRKRLS